jgi:2-C-methyl-D-erythritol 2,4-cyclodiphosphate synthase
LQLGDIGMYFSDRDPKNRNMDSKKIIDLALKHLLKSGFKLVNVDMTVICENIILGKHKEDICKSLQKILKIKYVNVKATRYEHPSNLIACHSVVLISK